MGQLLYILTSYFNIFVEKYKIECQKKKTKTKTKTKTKNKNKNTKTKQIKTQPLFSNIMGRSEKGKQTSFFLGLIAFAYPVSLVSKTHVTFNCEFVIIIQYKSGQRLSKINITQEKQIR